MSKSFTQRSQKHGQGSLFVLQGMPKRLNGGGRIVAELILLWSLSTITDTSVVRMCVDRSDDRSDFISIEKRAEKFRCR